MTKITTKPDSLQPATEMAVDLFDNWFDPIETEVRARSRQFIEELIRSELDAALSRPRYGRSQMDRAGCRVLLRSPQTMTSQSVIAFPFIDVGGPQVAEAESAFGQLQT